MIKPSKQDLTRLTEAILSAFNYDEIKRFTRLHLDFNIELIIPVSGKRDLIEVAARLVEYFASEKNGLHRLLNATIDANPNNSQLKNLADEWHSLEFEPLSVTKNISQAPFLSPLPSGPLIGRESEFKSIKEQLLSESQENLIAIHGIPGVGKSAMAVAIASDSDIQARFSDGILWAGLGKNPELESILINWGSALGINANEMSLIQGIEEKVRRLRSVIGKQKMLIIFDDLWVQQDETLSFFLGGPMCKHVVTSRAVDVVSELANHKNIFHVQELDNRTGVELLKTFAPQVVENEPDAAVELVNAVGGLPLALEIMGKYLKVQSRDSNPRRVRNALSLLTDTQERLELSVKTLPFEQQPNFHNSVEISLAAVIQLSTDILSREAQSTLRELTVFPPKPNSFPEAAAYEVSSQQTHAVDELVDSGLLQLSATTRYAVHQTIYDFVLSQSQPTPHSISKMVGYYIDFLVATDNNRLTQVPELANISAAIAYLFTSNLHDHHTTKVVFVHAGFLIGRGEYNTAQKYLEWAELAVRESGCPNCLAGVLQNQAQLQFHKGGIDEAISNFDEAEAIARSSGDNTSLAQVLVNYCNILINIGFYDRAWEKAEEGLRLSTTIEQTCHYNFRFSQICWHRGDIENMLKYAQKGFELAQRDNLLEQMPFLYVELGLAQTLMKHFGLAKQNLLKGLEIARELASPEETCSALINLSILHGMIRDSSKEERYLNEALQYAESVGSVLWLAEVKFRQADRYLRAEKIQRAREIFNALLEETDKIGFRELKAQTLYKLSVIAYEFRQPEKAIELAIQSLTLFDEMNHQRASIVKDWLNKIVDKS